MTMVTIEQTAPGKWVAEVESGGFICRREHLVSDSWENILAVVDECHKRLTAPPAPQGVHGGEKELTAQPAFAPPRRPVYQGQPPNPDPVAMAALDADIEKRKAATRHQTRPLGKV
jgi:hypothetical protein